MFIVDKNAREFIAKIVADLGKAILTVGFASYFFEKLPILFRIGFVILGVIFLVASVMLYTWKGEEQ